MLLSMRKRVWANIGLCWLASGRLKYTANPKMGFTCNGASQATKMSWNATPSPDCVFALLTSLANLQVKLEIFGGLSPLHVFACARIHFDLLPGLDEEWGLDGDAGFQGDRLLDVVGRIAADA